MDIQAKSLLSLILPTTLAGLVGTGFLVAAVLAGPTDADARVERISASTQIAR